MNKPPSPTRRRLYAWSATLALLAIVAWIARGLHTTYQREDWFTGFVLLFALAGLMLLSLRKKLLALPLGRVSFWMQAHQYLGSFALAAFFLHAGLAIHGWMEGIMAFLFLFTSFSGIAHWYFNRTIPRRLRNAGPDHLLADMPSLKQNIAMEAYSIAIAAAGTLGSAVLSEHYRKSLADFFQQPRSIAYAVVPNGRLRRRHLDDLERLDRYLSDDGRSARSQMCSLVRHKDDLDFQEAMQLRLRFWNAIHVSAIGLLWLLVGLHVILVVRFQGN